VDRGFDDLQGEASTVNILGRVLRAVGRYPEARDAHERALELFRGLGNRQGEAIALNCLGYVAELTGDFAAASEAHTRALEIFRAIGFRFAEAYANVELARMRLALGEKLAARDELAFALEIFREVGNRFNEAWALNYYAATFVDEDRPRAFELYRQALAMNRELSKQDDEAVSLEGLAECHLADGAAEAAAEHFRQAVEIFRRLGMDRDARRAQGRLDSMV
jgi:tetratricopeptide (TPR) repeat protein